MNPTYVRRNKNVSATVLHEDTDAVKNAQLAVAGWRKLRLAIAELIKQLELLKEQCALSSESTERLLATIAQAEKMPKDKTDQNKPRNTENNAAKE